MRLMRARDSDQHHRAGARINLTAQIVGVLVFRWARSRHSGRYRQHRMAGTWASRGAGIGGEAALQAAKVLRKNILDVASVILQTKPDDLDIVNNAVVDVQGGQQRIELNELARIVYFRPDTLPPGIQPELMATRHFVPREYPFAFTNGVQASWLEVDPQTGFIKLLKHWVVEDCGTIINPQLVDEQIRGGVVQGLGAALYEHCIYDERGQLTNANMADYLVPMAGEILISMSGISCLPHLMANSVPRGPERQEQRRRLPLSPMA